jgi:hypothetical protein
MNSISMDIHRVAEVQLKKETIHGHLCGAFDVTFVIFLDAEGQEIARVKAFMEAV